MARPRTPLSVAKSTGRTLHDPARFKGRTEPFSPPLGGPSPDLWGINPKHWSEFTRTLPWLTEADRCIVDIACTLRSRVLDGSADATDIAQLRLALNVMGATPVARSKFTAPDAGSDPADKFIN